MSENMTRANMEKIVQASSIAQRPVDQNRLAALLAQDCHPVLARLLAARGVGALTALQPSIDQLLPPDSLLGIAQAANLLANAIEAGNKLLVVGDYDCDGATACAVMVLGLRRLGATVDFLVPNRFVHGYGLTPAIVALAQQHPRLGRPDVLITVDNGIASIDGVAAARAAGMRVVVTDHHLPAAQVPQADAIVNPNQHGCPFPSKHLAGVGVALYVLLAIRAQLRQRGAFSEQQPALIDLLDMVALGTVADLVKLDANNRTLVNAGLKQIRAGKASIGVRALLTVAGVEHRRCATQDLGFALGPRINAAGRLEDISLGIALLTSDDPNQATQLAHRLDAINRQRREVESQMRGQAELQVDQVAAERRTVCVRNDDWNEGVIGLVASRIKDKVHRPVFAFAASSADSNSLRASGRSISGVHLRDVLDLISKREPDLIDRFGGHAMAAGLSLNADHYARFTAAFETAVQDFADPASFIEQRLCDGPLAPDYWSVALIEQFNQICWGQGFPAPLFCDIFEVGQQRVIKDKHLKLSLRLGRHRIEAIYFNQVEWLAARSRILFQAVINEFNGRRTLEFMVRFAESA